MPRKIRLIPKLELFEEKASNAFMCSAVDYRYSQETPWTLRIAEVQAKAPRPSAETVYGRYSYSLGAFGKPVANVTCVVPEFGGIREAMDSALDARFQYAPKSRGANFDWASGYVTCSYATNTYAVCGGKSCSGSLTSRGSQRGANLALICTNGCEIDPLYQHYFYCPEGSEGAGGGGATGGGTTSEESNNAEGYPCDSFLGANSNWNKCRKDLKPADSAKIHNALKDTTMRKDGAPAICAEMISAALDYFSGPSNYAHLKLGSSSVLTSSSPHTAQFDGYYLHVDEKFLNEAPRNVLVNSLMHEAAHSVLGYNNPSTHVPDESGNYHDFPFSLLDRGFAGTNFGAMSIPSSNECLKS
jgi:hypothetical protein